MSKELSRRDFLRLSSVAATGAALGFLVPNVLASPIAGPEHPGNCITGELNETDLSREWFVVYLDGGDTEFELKFGGRGTEMAPDSSLQILDQGIIPGTRTPFYVVQYLNRKGNSVIHYCHVTDKDNPIPKKWWKEGVPAGGSVTPDENRIPTLDLSKLRQSKKITLER